MRAQIITNMANKDKYKSVLERYKQALIKNPKLNLSAYCRLNGASISGMHHYIEDIGQSVKSIRNAVLTASGHSERGGFVQFTADSPCVDARQSDMSIKLSNGTMVSVSNCDADTIVAVLNALK